MIELLNFTTISRIFDGVFVLLFVAFLSIFIATFCGLIMGRVMIVKNILLYVICKLFLEIVRVIPLIAWLFIIFYGIPSTFNIHINAFMSAIIVFSMWGTAEMGDLVRASILSIPKHQRESALALGFNAFQIEIFVILPQALKALIPSAVNLFGRIIKTTSLLSLIGVVELLKVGHQLIEVFGKNDHNISFIVYGGILVIYFCLCYPFAYLGNYLEKRLKT
ncbi:amino acid ABC transporter permease [Helicobacter didelphidarum]|uniref:Amino acid ABC transporter permease n=1 Tax=Helicobacter didelphidarum TaxID=2040648 RepID=A0A3D8IQ24_9HELI|nr:amino acid ABC transporter permease [Helicobacter didelphidarum]RDU67006.1 amino acid ABC transporter permease [Helicobacter didelphidarum]